MRIEPLNHSPEGLRYALEQSGLLARELAKQVGRSEAAVSYWLSGNRSMSHADIKKVAAALNCPRVVIERKRETE